MYLEASKRVYDRPLKVGSICKPRKHLFTKKHRPYMDPSSFWGRMESTMWRSPKTPEEDNHRTWERNGCTDGSQANEWVMDGATMIWWTTRCIWKMSLFSHLLGFSHSDVFVWFRILGCLEQLFDQPISANDLEPPVVHTELAWSMIWMIAVHPSY